MPSADEQYELELIEDTRRDPRAMLTDTSPASADGLTLHSIGQDVMTGGGARETSAFTPGFGQDEISDFVVGGPDHDTLDLSATRYRSLAGLLSHTTMGDDGTATIHLTPQDSITIDGVSKAQLKAHPQDVAFG